MSIECVPVVAFDHNVVAGQLPEVCSLFGVESPGILEKYGYVSSQVDGIPLRPSIFNPDDDSSRSREDGLTPTKAILQSDAENKVMERVGPIETRSTGPRIYADEIISVSVAKHVGSVAW